MFLLLPAAYAIFKPYLGIALLFLCAILIISSYSPLLAAAVLSASGLLGFLALSLGFCPNPLTALFCGFFGMAQNENNENNERHIAGIEAMAPVLGLFLVMLPAATPFLIQPFSAASGIGAGSESLLISKMLYDLCASFAIGKPRSMGGALIAESGMPIGGLYACIAAGFFGIITALGIGKALPKPSRRQKRWMDAIARIAIICIVAALCGANGILVMACAMAIAGFCRQKQIGAGYCLGCIYIPSAAYSLGLFTPLAKLFLGL